MFYENNNETMIIISDATIQLVYDIQYDNGIDIKNEIAKFNSDCGSIRKTLYRKT